MEQLTNFFEKILPFLERYDNWVKWYVSLCIIVSAIGLVILIIAPKKPVNIELPSPNSPVIDENAIFQWKLTGESKIDDVLRNLNVLERTGIKEVSQSSLAETLRPLMSRSAFVDLREGNWDDFLFPLIKTRLILEHYTPYFRERETRVKILEATRILIELQNRVVELYGRQFDINVCIRKGIDSYKEFIACLPSKMKDPTKELDSFRLRSMTTIRSSFEKIDLAEF